MQVIPFLLARKSRGYRTYFKGVSEILAKTSTFHKDGNYDGIETEDIDKLSRETFIFYTNLTLRTTALSYLRILATTVAYSPQ